MAPATQIVILKLKDPSASLADCSSAAKTWSTMLTTILAQPGAQRLFWGVVVEDPSLVRLFVEWKSLEHKKIFTSSEAHHPFRDMLYTIFTDITLLAHAELKPLPEPASSAFVSPATELLTVFFPAEYSVQQQEKVAARIDKLVQAIDGKAKGCRCAAAGWAVDTDVPNLKKPGVKGRAFFLFVGWDSIEDHLAFRGTDVFKENIHYLRDAEDMQEFLNMHFHGTEVVGKA